ncbi:MAG TPA: lipoprotein insertase outer membrane protein LolB [Luteimonas sp.]|nr:lipoprotein insertase outer membrane protein LolB [Luteimonas sp.]
MSAAGKAALLACVCMAGCVSQPARLALPALSPTDIAAAEAAQSTRETALAAQPAWMLSGRVAVSRGRDGGSGRLDWRQDGDQFTVTLAAPVTRQGWRLDGDGSGARLDGLEGGTREGPDAAALLLDATRLEVPVAALASWVRGARADVTRFGPAEVAFGADRRPARLVQGGWTIDYRSWVEVDDRVLPQRLDAVRGDARVRLVVDSWGGHPAP